MRHPFWCCVNTTNIPHKPFFEWWHMFNAFVSICVVVFRTTHGQNKPHRFYTGGFVPISSLCGIVDSPSWFTKCLLFSTGNILSVVYINAKCIYLSEIRVCTTLECAIVRFFLHVTSTWPLISWWSGDDNSSCTPHKERPYWNFL